ncbi:hypothetical protein [Dokdonia sp.]|uniref:hypothetical protein n=1 Tax=Dokdonia sp. TaxID=2024995 RepID=UPI003265F38D
MDTYKYQLGLGKKCGWFCRNWKKIAGAAAAVIGGPVGIIIGIAIQAIPDQQDKFSSQTEFSPAIDNQLDSWAKQRFNKWFERKLLIFQGKKTRSQLLHIDTIKLVNNNLNEMQNLVKYYQVKAKGEDLNYAKSIVIKDAIIEYKDLYVNALASVGGKIYVGTTPVSTRAILNGPDIINWNGKSYTIEVPFFSSKPVNTIVLPPVINPGDSPHDGGIKPTKPITDIIRPVIPITALPDFQTPPFRPENNKPIVKPRPTGQVTKPVTKPTVQTTKPAMPTIVIDLPKKKSNTILKGLLALATVVGISKAMTAKKKK